MGEGSMGNESGKVILRPHKLLYFVVGGFIGGVFIHSFFNVSIYFSVFIVLLAFTFMGLFFLKRRLAYLFTALVFLGGALGLLRFTLAELDKGDAYMDMRLGTDVTIEGVVIDEPDRRETSTKLTLEVAKVDGRMVRERALITVDRYPAYVYGDEVVVRGELLKPKAFVGEDERIFDYASYLGKDGIYYLLFFPEVERVGVRQGHPVKQFLFDTKELFIRNIGRAIPEPESSLLGGLVVGAKQSLGERLLDDFRKTGIVHIVVLSGYNVTIVAEFIMRVLSFLPLVATWSLGIFSVALFAIMTGAGATIVRASIMAILVIIARATGRTYQMTHALILAAFFMILHNPKILVFDASFQLSFMATLGLIHLAPKLEHYFGWVPTKLQLREFATATIATQLFVLPLLLYKIGDLSIVALPVNLLVLPVVPLTMLVGFLTGVAGTVNMTLSLPFAYISDALLSYQLFVVGLFAQLPFASVYIESFPIGAVLGVYLLYGFVIYKLYQKEGLHTPSR